MKYFLKVYKFLFLGIFLFVLTACPQDEEIIKPTPFGEEFYLSFAKTKQLEEEISIKFSTVIGDSRCPRNVECISAGEVTLFFDLFKAEKNIESFSLTFGEGQNDPNRPRKKEIQGYLIEMIEVNPYPQSTSPMGEELYEVVLKVSKL
jgi:hypothetical protein